MQAIISGISAIVLSKNKKNQLLVSKGKHTRYCPVWNDCICFVILSFFYPQSWFLLVVSVLAFLSGGASTVGISVATVRAIMNEGETLFTHCQRLGNISYYSITNECPFDPTRVYVSLSISCVGFFCPIIKVTVVWQWKIFLFPGYNINPVVSVDFDVIGWGGVLLPLFLSLHLVPPPALPMEEKYQQKGKPELHGIR